ncbi:hypothetical protein CYLTODRAFT_417503 [Cylindrobasidium torrendii FP15055 ss-10]|uniref:Sucraseferredoxin-like protein n=1 Tax=Cylindrobasidium torrendii FP15055 ss-10 TaxID=1314674 RepID=A0A0D7BRD0_9AGAR|nr:hypothetical protein CYLTODRAFT_417503 [Cylindrobasidium torrendii FP15055 ss-10]
MLSRIGGLLGHQRHSSHDVHENLGTLQTADVPVTAAQCRGCGEPCEEGHESYGTRFDVDMASQMLGSMKGYRRQVCISTGKTDWEREVTDVTGSLAALLGHVHKSKSHSTPIPTAVAMSASDNPPAPSEVAGVYSSSSETKISPLNGSHRTISDDPDLQTVLVFPDYKIVANVAETSEGAQQLWDEVLDPKHGIIGAMKPQSPLRTWPLPYSCVILLCSHKRRDNRCAVAAAKLEHEFMSNMGSKGWTVDLQLEHPHDDPIELVDAEKRESHVLERLKELPDEKSALIVHISHIGGHKYAGNVIIYTPQGAGVWYGRVTTHEVDAIVEQTIVGGQILPSLLRGGVNISRPGCSSLNDW